MKEILNINSKKIGVHEYGDKNGFPVFYFHGFPGSRLDGKMFDFNKVALKHKIRLIGLDRPGIGFSDFSKKRELLDWPKSVSSVADILNINEFSVFGLSGGGPYALACAYSMPDRIRSISVVSGMGPSMLEETKNDLALFVPRLIKPLRIFIAWSLKNGARKNQEKLIKNINKTLSKTDINYLSHEGRMTTLLIAFTECFRQGLRGYLKEAELYRNDWGFKLSDINTAVNIWHGKDDKNVSPDVAERMAKEISDCKTRIIENEGHFSLTGNYLDEILADLKIKEMIQMKA